MCIYMYMYIYMCIYVWLVQQFNSKIFLAHLAFRQYQSSLGETDVKKLLRQHAKVPRVQMLREERQIHKSNTFGIFVDASIAFLHWF